jgi:ubiquinone biosynthesis protein COQ4
MGPFSMQFQVGRALTAARALASNPDDLPQVFTIVEALSGNTYARVARRTARTESGRRLLRDMPDVVEKLADRAALARLPEGTLGRAYLTFVESENISAEGIRAANEQGRVENLSLPEPLRFVHARMRDTHDLWHAAVGYRGDVLGETALLAFTFAQTRSLGVALIIGIGLVKLAAYPQAHSVILDGYRRGRKAAFLPAAEWESLLDQPLAEVRARLGLEAPPVYERILSADLRAQAVPA